MARYERQHEACQVERGQVRGKLEAQLLEEKTLRGQLAARESQHAQVNRELNAQLESNHKALGALQAEQARLLHTRSGLKLKAQDLAATYARMQARSRSEILRSEEREKLDLDLAPLMEQDALKVEARGEHTVIVLPMDLMFSLGEAGLNSTGLTQLQQVSKAIRATYAPGKIWMQVQGHTDNIPKRTATIRNNWELSAARALAVVAQLIEAGFDPEHIQAAAFGPFRPVADNASRQGRALNRRVAIVISPRDPKGKSPPHH